MHRVVDVEGVGLERDADPLMHAELTTDTDIDSRIVRCEEPEGAVNGTMRDCENMGMVT